MKKSHIYLVVLFFFTCSLKNYACTTFLLCQEGEILFGRNYDWMSESGMLCTNLRELSKTSQKQNDGYTIKWVSKYGSVTFNQYGKEFPTGGMNEKGLVVELMWMNTTTYPKKDSRASISGLQWIQYQLDNCATINEVINTDKDLRISTTSVPLHFLIADATGKAATIEFINGNLIVHKNENLPFSVLANDDYSYSLKEHDKIIEKDTTVSFQSNSIERFTKACNLISNYNPKKENINSYAFRILDEVKQGTFTKWSIVYDIKNKHIHFKTLSNSNIKQLNVESLNFNCNTEPLMLNLSNNYKGNVNDKLKQLTDKLNAKILTHSIKQSKPKITFSDDSKLKTLNYAKSIQCKSEAKIIANSIEDLRKKEIWYTKGKSGWSKFSDVEYVYNTKDELIKKIARKVKNDNLVYDYLDSNTYADNGNLLIRMREKWKNGQWIPATRLDFYYESGKIINRRDSIFIGSDLIVKCVAYNYNNKGYLLSEVSYNVNREKEEKNIGKTVYINNNKGKYIEKHFMIWQDEKYINSRKMVLKYNDNGHHINTTRYNWKNNQWVESIFYELEVDEKGNRISELWQRASEEKLRKDYMKVKYIY